MACRWVKPVVNKLDMMIYIYEIRLSDPIILKIGHLARQSLDLVTLLFMNDLIVSIHIKKHQWAVKL